MASADRPVRAVAASAIGAGLIALAGTAAVHLAGRRVRGHHDPAMDAQRGVPGAVAHHHVAVPDGGSIHVAEQGHGRPVVLLHGVGLQWWAYSAQFRLLAGHARVLAWDMRGHGDSGVGDDGMSLRAVADDLAAVLEQLDLRDSVVVGHSMGGMALARFCAAHPEVLDERVSAMVFLSTSAATIDADTTIGAVVGLSNMITRVSRDGSRFHYGWRDTNLSALLVRAAFGRRPSGRAVDDVRRMMSELPPEIATAVGRSIATHDVRSELAHVRTPTAVVVGSADRLTSVRHAKVIAEEIDGAELHVLQGIGHQVMQEAPEELVEIIEDLLATTATR